MKKTMVAMGLFLALTLGAAEKTVAERLMDVSVTVRAEAGYQRSEGSGTLYKRAVKTPGGEVEVVYCWTAAHVISHMRTVREEIIDGKPVKIVEFGNPSLVRKLRNPATGRIVGELVVTAKVLKYSDSETGHDLALLQVLAKDFKVGADVKFYPKGGKLVPVGTRLRHCGSLYGDDGSGSITDGILSAHGRLLNGKILLTQTTCVSFPGSSGGGVFWGDQYIGMLVRGTRVQGFNLHVPISRMHIYATEAKCTWALGVGEVTQKEIDVMPIEDVRLKGGGPKLDSKAYPFLIRVTNLKPE